MPPMLRRTSLLWRSSCGQSEDEKDDVKDQDYHMVSVYQDDDDQYVRVVTLILIVFTSRVGLLGLGLTFLCVIIYGVSK